MNRSPNRLFAASAGLAVCGLILTGCSSGQISQTADQEAAVNGMSANAKNIALRNVHLLATQTGGFLQPGQILPLAFVAANNSPDVNDKLLSITSEVGTVAIAGDGVVPAGQALVMAPKGPEQPTASTADVTLTQPITNGISYPFTFTFEKAGQTTVPVPISAGEVPH